MRTDRCPGSQTKGLSLERMDVLFGVTEALSNHIEVVDSTVATVDEGVEKSNKARVERV